MNLKESITKTTDQENLMHAPVMLKLVKLNLAEPIVLITLFSNIFKNSSLMTYPTK
jgi:hypothetical protein